MMHFLSTGKSLLSAIIRWIKQHIIMLLGLSLGFFGGMMLALIGFLVGFFVETLIKRLKKDSFLESRIENPFMSIGAERNSNLTSDEPFEGALLVAALGVYCTGNPSFAGLQMKKHFSNQYSADWESLCRIASLSESLNGDLITECLAATLLKKNGTGSTLDSLLVAVFTFLSTVEYDWNIERGGKPSVYLSELLRKPVSIPKTSQEELEKAYSLLGVLPTDDVAVIKSAHRSLVSLYHPDTLKDFSEEQKKIAAEAFLRIQTAYENILSSKAK